MRGAVLAMHVRRSLVVLVALAACDGGAERPEPPIAIDPAPTPEPEPVSDPPEPEVAPSIGACGIPNSTREERAGCASDQGCMLSAINFQTCREDSCGSPSHAYNCAFAARVATECAESTCDSGLHDLDLGCGRGDSAPMHAVCVDGFCEARVRPSVPQSRLLRVTGAVAEREVLVAIRRELRRIEACFPTEDGADDEPLVLRIEVSPRGMVQSASVTNRSDGDPTLVGCVSRAVRAIRFPASRDGEVAEVMHRFARPRPPAGCEGAPGGRPPSGLPSPRDHED